MDYTVKVDEYQNRLDLIRSQLNSQSKEAEEKIEAHQTEVLQNVRCSVEAINKLVESGNLLQQSPFWGTNTASRMNLNYSACKVPLDDERAIIKARAQTLQISGNFKKLSASADLQLDTIMEANLQVIEIEDTLDKLKLELDGSVSQLSTTIASTEKTLAEKNTELKEALKKKGEVEAETATVEAKLAGNKEDRNVLRVLRGVAWGASLAIPIVGIPVALAMEAGNLELKDRKNIMKAQRETLQTQCTSLENNSKSIESDKIRLRSLLSGETALAQRCGDISLDLRASKTLLGNKANDYRILKEAAGRFLGWSETIESRSDILTMATDMEELKESTERLRQDLLKCKEERVLEICAPLERLSLEWM